MIPKHHLPDETLLAYAAGTLSEGWGLAVATHVALCAECRARVAAAEAIGGAVLDDAEPEPVGDDAFAAVMARIDREPAMTVAPAKPVVEDRTFPEPLRSYLHGGRDLAWKRLGAIHQVIVPTADASTTCRLFRIPGGMPLPVHGHRGAELTLVLTGAFTDGAGTFARGDIQAADEEIEHQPVALPGEVCIAFAVTDARLRLKGMARLFQPFLRI